MPFQKFLVSHHAEEVADAARHICLVLRRRAGTGFDQRGQFVYQLLCQGTKAPNYHGAAVSLSMVNSALRLSYWRGLERHFDIQPAMGRGGRHVAIAQ